MNEKEKFTESHIIYSRILWDDALDKQHFWIGFTDRMSASGIREKYLLDWNPEGDIPWHRVVYIRCKDIKVWDRKQKVDLFKEHKLPDFVWKQADNPFDTQIISNGALQMQFDHRPCYGFVGNEWQLSSILEGGIAPFQSESGQGVRFLTWNVLKNTHNPELTYSDTRLPAILQQIKEAEADVIALQEVTKDFYQKLLAQDWAKQYFVSDLPTADVFEQDTIVILSKFPFVVTEHIYSKHKRLLIARFSGNESLLYVATVHLTSDMSNNSSQKRAQQMQVFFDWLNTIQGEVLVLGDFNADTDEQTQLFGGKGFSDVWVGKEGFTYNPEKNLLAQMLSPTQRVRRLDALHLRSSHWQARQVSLYATEPFAEVAGKPLFCSDHFGVLATLEFVASKDLPTPFANAKPTYQSVLAWVPPQSVWRNIQEIRALHDSKYNRWMPHITLIYGFIAEELFAEAVPLIAEAVADLQPFEVTLESVQFFEHRQSFTAWLQPDANATRQLQVLQARLQKIFPTCDEQSNRKPPMEKGGDISYSFTPHLSIGQFDSLEELQKIVPLWKPVKTQISEIVLKSREKDTPFVVRYQIPLGRQGFTKVVPAWQVPIDRLMPTLTSKDKENRATVLGIISQACAEAIPQTVQVEQMGSSYLGINTPQSDIDVVCIIPKEVERTFFLNKLQEVLSLFATAMRLAEDAQVPVLKLVINEVAVDILVAQSPIFPVVFALPALLRQQQHFDTLSWQIISGILEAETLLKTAQEVVSLDNFRWYVRAVRAWAKARGLVGNGWGYLGSYSWTVLTVNALLAYPKQEQIPSLEAFLAFFFKWYALYDWKEVVALTRVGKAYKAHKRDKMPIMTSIEPCFNSAKNVTRSTFKRIKAELNRAHNLTKKTPHESNWDTLFDKAELVGKGSDFCLEIRIESIDDKILTQSVGWLEGNIVGLFAELEKDANLILEFLPTLAYQAQSAVFKTFIYFENTEKQILEGVLNDFLQKFGGQATMIGKIL